MPLTPVLTKRFGTNQPWKIANYEALDGYTALRVALTQNPDSLIETVRNSNLRGRGGAGFPTGMKWAFISQAKPGEPVKPHYVVVNADEGEPGTCRDLPLMMNDPHSMIEGIIIADVPSIDPAVTVESKSSGTSRCSAVNSGVDEPPGVQNLSGLPRLIPPAMSISSRRVVPIGASY